VTVNSSDVMETRTPAQILSDIAALPLAGGTLTGALSGTSATFSGNAIIGSTGAVSTRHQLRFNNWNTTNSYPYITLITPTGSLYSGIGINTSNDFVIGRTNGLDTDFTQQDLKISNSTGAATFSNNVLVGGTSYSVPAGYTGIGINNATNGGILDLLLNDVKKGELYITSTSFNMYGFAGVGLNLTVDNNASKGLSIATTGAATFSADVNTSGKFKGKVGGSGVAFETTNAVDADFTIETVAGGTTKIGTSGNKLAINSGGGNVGIGETSPNHKLDINSATTALNVGNSRNSVKALSTFGKTVTSGYGTSDNYIQIGAGENGLNSTRLIGFGYSVTANTNQPAYIGYIETSNSGETKGSLIFGTRDVTTDTAPSERMRITSGGNVGIGTESPNGLLHIQQCRGGEVGFRITNSQGAAGNTSATVAINMTLQNGSGGSSGVIQLIAGKESDHQTAANVDDYFAITTTSNDVTSERMRITSGGAITTGGLTDGYLTATNRGNITIYGSTDSILSLRSGASGAGYFYHTGTHLEIYNTNSGYIKFATENAEVLRLTKEAWLYIQNRTAAPAANPVTGGYLYCESGALKYRGSSGTVTTIANA